MSVQILQSYPIPIAKARGFTALFDKEWSELCQNIVVVFPVAAVVEQVE